MNLKLVVIVLLVLNGLLYINKKHTTLSHKKEAWKEVDLNWKEKEKEVETPKEEKKESPKTMKNCHCGPNCKCPPNCPNCR